MIVSVCVVAYNEEKVLGKLLEDIQAQDYDHGKMEVVLIDSMSTDSKISTFFLTNSGGIDACASTRIITSPEKFLIATFHPEACFFPGFFKT